MPLPTRTPLVRVDPILLSAYDAQGRTGGPRTALVPLVKRQAGQCPADVATALLGLHNAVQEAGGDFRVTDCYRSVAEQAAARKRYETWLAAGKPKPGTSAWNAATMKAAYVAVPGKSFHNAGRAIDVDIASLEFPIPVDRQLDCLWELAIPLGWRPIIKAPDERASEAWHFDAMGEWGAVYDRLGYETAAMCAVLDIGQGDGVIARPRERIVQANLQRAGYDVGEVDGLLGKRTAAGLAAASVAMWDFGKLFALPASPRVIWPA